MSNTRTRHYALPPLHTAEKPISDVLNISL
nr:MAG TPA: hypothetical protein [Inoviridae sp.]